MLQEDLSSGHEGLVLLSAAKRLRGSCLLCYPVQASAVDLLLQASPQHITSAGKVPCNTLCFSHPLCLKSAVLFASGWHHQAKFNLCWVLDPTVGDRVTNRQHLRRCRNLLSKKCGASGTALAVDTITQHFMPPILRPYRVGIDELQLAASPAAIGNAFHMQSAPAHAL